MSVTGRDQVTHLDDIVEPDRDHHGGKGAGLAVMRQQGLPVPPALVVSTSVCRDYLATGALPPDLLDRIAAGLERLARETGRRFGDPEDPLLLSVRSGAPVSMPGMMDTVLNVGLDRRAAEHLAARVDPVFAWDTYRRFLVSFGSVVLGVPEASFGPVPEQRTPQALRAAVERAEEVIVAHRGAALPDDPLEHLGMAIEAVFRSWESSRARNYRALEGIADDLGTAVVIQAMVFGNRDDRSATGVAFTRDPNTGQAVLYGDVLFRAQGEDVVSGRHQTLPLDTLRERLPRAWSELVRAARTLEHHIGDMCDIEFTVESGRLWLLQVRRGKRTPAAAVRIAVDLVDEGLITPTEALLRIDPDQLTALARHELDAAGVHDELARGLAASPGTATGPVCFDPDRAVELAAAGTPPILLRRETSPADLHGMVAAAGILTCSGGLVSHAAVVARELAKPAVVGASLTIAPDGRAATTADGRVLREQDIITIDGSSGLVICGQGELVASQAPPQLARLIEWARDLLDDAPHDDPVETLRRARELLSRPRTPS